MLPGCGMTSPPGVSQVLPPSLDLWMICPNQPLDCDAYSRFGSAGDPLMWYISQPAKCGPLTSHFSRLPSDVRTNAPLRVPTSTRTLLICASSPGRYLCRFATADKGVKPSSRPRQCEIF